MGLCSCYHSFAQPMIRLQPRHDNSLQINAQFFAEAKGRVQRHPGESPVSNVCTSMNGLRKQRGSIDMTVFPLTELILSVRGRDHVGQCDCPDPTLPAAPPHPSTTLSDPVHPGPRKRVLRMASIKLQYAACTHKRAPSTILALSRCPTTAFLLGGMPRQIGGS
eukprot:COSAG02_NODE_20727_length_817_cov_1.647632_1_plen_164_part_00